MINVWPRKWIVLAVVTLVSFITNVDATIVIIGLPSMVEGLHITMVTGLWIITSYIITSTIFLLPAGRWADMVGTKPIFILGFGIFTIATVLCGIANSGTTLIIFRFIQGAGAALALATATPIIVRTFPPHQLGLAVGINSTSWVIGSIAGPVVGGALIGQYGWPAIFFVTVPFGVIGMIAAWFVLEDTDAPVKSKTDWMGMSTFGIGLVALLIALSEGQVWGWVSAPILGLFLTTLVAWIAFVITELRVKHPMFNFSLLSNIHYSAGLGITLNYCIGYFGITFLLTLYLQGALHLSPLQSGMLLIPLSAPQLIMGPLGGVLADRFGPVRMMMIGLIFLSGGLFLLGNLGLQLSMAAIVVPLIIISISNGIAWPSLAKTVLSAAPREHSGSASGMFYTIYNVGRALSQTLALAAVEFSVAPDIISQALMGGLEAQDQNIENSLVHSIDNSFLFFILFFALALLLILLLRRTNSGIASKVG
ncbi:DHA2 family efflux MFS transporter permease subunit [Pelosinus sp. UFO1]|uniref:DHA2 family efflux MFS transporter permease subunit n=1 Tax=Pelosinus sp. UFO1 TaxID=484770 RepID=UPI0004D147FD|nr:DHA2 family efflux MFS transporter permease subunit [Pelosinus sp. UFO1]AIF49771.1 drug resistance transporter, EmrB/QacA subfamily [Pelosinus sp. UFO1]